MENECHITGPGVRSNVSKSPVAKMGRRYEHKKNISSITVNIRKSIRDGSQCLQLIYRIRT